jgi:hypothetical protein
MPTTASTPELPVPAPAAAGAARLRALHERASSAVEYVGLAALSMMVVSGIATALDGAAGARLGSAIVRHLLAAITEG